MARGVSIRLRGKPVADAIRGVMRAHRLSRAEGAALMGVSIHTLGAWFRPSRSDAPKRALELLRLKLEREERGTNDGA